MTSLLESPMVIEDLTFDLGDTLKCANVHGCSNEAVWLLNNLKCDCFIDFPLCQACREIVLDYFRNQQPGIVWFCECNKPISEYDLRWRRL